LAALCAVAWLVESVTSPSMSLSCPGYRPVGLLADEHDLEDFPAEMGRDRAAV
jgi:hypothetical protein